MKIQVKEGEILRELPAIAVTWDPEKANIAGMLWDAEAFKNLDFLIAVLGMAVEDLKRRRVIQTANEMQAKAQTQLAQVQAQAALADTLKAQIDNGHRRRHG